MFLNFPNTRLQVDFVQSPVYCDETLKFVSRFHLTVYGNQVSEKMKLVHIDFKI